MPALRQDAEWSVLPTVTAHMESVASTRTAMRSVELIMSVMMERYASQINVKLDAGPMNSAWTILPASAISAEIPAKAAPPVVQMPSARW